MKLSTAIVICVVVASIWRYREVRQSQVVVVLPSGATPETEWAHDFLAGVGNSTPTHEIIGLVVAWQRAEGTEAQFNPLATTLTTDESTCYARSVNSGTCVKDYPTRELGLAATIHTITNGAYPHILHGLQTNDVEEALDDDELGTWGTGRGAVLRLYREWVATELPDEPTTPTAAAYTAPPLQVRGTGCLESNVTSAYEHSPGLQAVDIPPGTDWSFNAHWELASDLIACAGQGFTGGGVCNQASRYSNVARALGLPVSSDYHGYVYDSAVPMEDNIAIMSDGGRGGQDLVISNPTDRTVHMQAEMVDGQLIVSGSFS